MSRGRRNGNRGRQRLASAEQEQDRQENRDAVDKLHHSAYRNLRFALANVTIFFAIVSGFMLVTGDATRRTVMPMAACVLGGALGAGTYAVRGQPLLARYLLLSAIGLTLLGLVALVVLSQVAGT